MNAPNTAPNGRRVGSLPWLGAVGMVVLVIGAAAGSRTAAGLLVLAVLVAVLAGRRARAARDAEHTAAPGATPFHSHAGLDLCGVARHEAGHVAVARALGAHVIAAEASAKGGATWVEGLGGPVEVLAVLRGGELAARRGAAGCRDDRAERHALLDTLPRSQRGPVRREADRIARTAVREFGRQIRRDAAQLQRTGRL